MTRPLPRALSVALGHLALALLVSLAHAPGARAQDAADNVTNVTLGKTIERSWDEVKADNFAYGPK
jgi:hypothetical protein